MTEKMTENSELIGNEFLTIEDDILIKCDEEAEGTIKIPDSVKKIKWTAFWNSEKIKEIWLPAGIERFELNAFKNCTALEKIHYNGTKSQWKKIQPKFNRSPALPPPPRPMQPPRRPAMPPRKAAPPPPPRR